jgi:site-specific DNA recombinase
LHWKKKRSPPGCFAFSKNTKAMIYDALYGRQSLDKKDSISIESQLEYCRYETRGNPYMEYMDKGFSGKNTRRPGFEQMMADIKAGKIGRVIVYKLDRISRSILDFANMMDTFQEYQVEFVSSTEKFDTSTPIGRAMLHICIVFAQLERETIQKRVKDSYATRSRHGFYMGGRIPYGFCLKKTTIQGISTSMYQEVPEESRQLKLIYSMYADPSCSLGDIVRYLEEHQIQHLRGARWTTSRLSELLRSPVYVQSNLDVYRFFQNQGTQILSPACDFNEGRGCYLYQKSALDGRPARSLSEKELVLAPHKGLICAETWLACRMRCLNNRQSAKTCKPKHSWISGKIKCKNCGYALTVRKSKTKWGSYFVCSQSGSVKCPHGSGCTVYPSVLETYLAQAIQHKLKELPVPEASLAASSSLSQAKLRLAQIEEETTLLLEQIPKAGDTLMAYINERIEQLDMQRKHFQKELEAASSKSSSPAKSLYEYAPDWDALSFSEKQSVADALIQVIHVGNHTMEILWQI